MPMEIKETMPLQEMADKIAWKRSDGTEGPARVIKEHLERGFFDPYEPDILEAWRGTSKEDRAKFMNTVHSIDFADLLRATDRKTWHSTPTALREFLASSGTTGIAGAYYLIPVKLWDEMQTESVQADICAQISKRMIGPEAMPGTTLKVDIAVDGSYAVNVSTSGAIAPTETIDTCTATIDCSSIYTMNFRIGNDLIEDSQFDLIALHVQEAGRQVGEYASTLAATVLYSAADGDGTKNQITSDLAYTEWDSDGGAHTLEEAIILNQDDGYVPDTLLLTHKAFLYDIIGTSGAAGMESDLKRDFLKSGYPNQIAGMNIVWSDIAYLNAAAAKAVVFTKEHGMITARKRWMRVEHYSEPVKDLTGAVISFRQDGVTIYADSIAPYVEAS